MGAGALILTLLAGVQADPRIPPILARVSEEAEVFRQMAPKMLAQETLRQRARSMPRFRPRVGKAATEAPKPEYRTREIVSEYTYSSFRESPNVLHEFRQVISLDGRKVSTPEKARRTLALGVTSADDRLKRQMLEEFERHGLSGAAADFGQVILLFTRRRLRNYAFEHRGGGRIGADATVILAFRQTGGDETLTIFEKRKAIRHTLEGQLWVRANDWLPLRIVLASGRQEGGYHVRDEATVDYVMSSHGALVPAAVTRRRFAGDELIVEDIFQYSLFRKFSAEAEIKFQ